MLKASPGRHGENGIPQKLELQIKIERASKHLSRFSMKILCFKLFSAGFRGCFDCGRREGIKIFSARDFYQEKYIPAHANVQYIK